MGDAADDLFDAGLEELAAQYALRKAGVRECEVCQGEGYIMGEDATFASDRKCPRCSGAGHFDRDGCPVDIADIL